VGSRSRGKASVRGLGDKVRQKLKHFGYVSSKFSMSFRHFVYDIVSVTAMQFLACNGNCLSWP